MWNYNPNDYTEQDFPTIPAGDHRVRINDVALKTFSSGNEGFEITLDVSGYNSKLWFYLVFDSSDPKKTNQRIGQFFESFAITDNDLSHYRGWIGKIGGVRVKMDTYNGEERPKVAFCLARRNQEKLPAWKGDALAAPAPMAAPAGNFRDLGDDEDLPFN